jgi:hypothetical protein
VSATAAASLGILVLGAGLAACAAPAATASASAARSPAASPAREIAPGVTKEGDTVVVAPCELRFIASDQWMPAPKEVFDPPQGRGFMLGRRGVRDQSGHEVIPTVSVLWEAFDAADTTNASGVVADALLNFAIARRPDLKSPEFKLGRVFIWQDGLLTLRYASGWQYDVVLNGRPSRAIVVYTINRDKNLGIQIMAEIPAEVWPALQGEVEAILKSFVPTSPKVFGSRQSMLTHQDGQVLLDFEDSAPKP